MKKLLFAALVVVAASGCKSNPYCLNCKDSGNGVITPEDMIPSPIDGGDDGMTTGPDMVGSGACVPTNGGAEVCDGLDNDCNGKIDDVTQDRLIGDPKNCGACGNECKYPNAFGVCVGGFDGGMPTCKMSGCQPGYVDLDGMPANGCEYVCTPTAMPMEICDGKDNNCDGQVDEGFTTNWFDAAHQFPKYDSTLADCGQCGTVCNLGQGTVMACLGNGVNGRGQCAVLACFNGIIAGMHETYRHDPTKGPITTTGCEYHCPKPATTTGNNCNPNGACTFPVEVCNGLDDDCNFLSDDNPTDPGLNQPCPDGDIGEYCDVTTCGKGICTRGTRVCQGGGVQCIGSVGPQSEVCEGMVDENCDGQVDDGFTATWQDAGHQMPRYDLNTNNCGGCGAAFKCALPHAINKCRVAPGDNLGSCAVAACNPNFYYLAATGTPPACNQTPAPGPEDSKTGMTGVGCYYACTATGGEICDGKDNDCNGCVDDGLTAPPICNDTGTCHNNHSVSCDPVKGWICTYGAGVDTTDPGHTVLSATEAECDNLDNNCNGACDETFPDVPVNGAGCTNAPKTAKACSGGQGACLLTGAYACNAAGNAEACMNGATVIGPNGDLTKASDELCDGKDNDCNGLIDEATDYVVGGMTFKGWHDPVATLTVGADPFPTDPNLAAHTVYVYAYEASRPDATGTNAGAQSSRACANVGTLPWSNVKLKQAQSACAAVKDSMGFAGRVCTAWEWQQTCNGNAASGSHWSMSTSRTTYQAQVCNDSAETQQRCSPVSSVSCPNPKSCNANNKCTCTGDVDCPGAAVGSCVSGVCNNVAVCTGQCLKACNASGQCTCSGDPDCNAGFNCVGNVCVGAGAWPTGSIGFSGATNFCYSDLSGVATGAGQAHDLSGNLQEWTSTNVVLKSGAAASMTASAGGLSTITGLTNMFASDFGAQIVILPPSADAGTYDIVTVNSATSVTVAAASAVAASGLSWQFVYNKVRGGNFTTTSSGGDTCEFDFDIQKASFANTDVGFRCCFDHAP